MTFTPGQTVAIATVVIFDDLDVEDVELFTVQLQSSFNVVHLGVATIHIFDNDSNDSVV